ncbi:hypothetical protein [Aestuariivivens sediminicola]|uniref:hypothetical protein n=1 Tax=Aestuariivivens sediminicola TaxID=2913560 RepID=UPI001F560A7E|nr:hypothetical protein [Aestuariivivens sediminicola]
MKFLYSIILVFSFQFTQAQAIGSTTAEVPQELYDYHTLKHKKNKTTAWILLGSGVAMTVVGFAALKNDGERLIRNLFTGKDASAGPSAFLIIGGGVATLASIPFFLSAGKHKRKATLSLKGGNILVRSNTFQNLNNLSAALTIEF